MKRFLNDFDKADKIRNMGFTLQFLLSTDMLITALTYYGMKTAGLLDDDTDHIVYLAWIATLTLTMIPMALNTAVTISKLRFVYRILHMVSVIGVYFMYGHFVVPSFYIIYYFAEFVYLHRGTKNGQMEWPGKWMADLTDKYQEDKKQRAEKQAETVRSYPFTSVAHEVIRKDCTIEDEFSDDLFDYHSAYEDELFPTVLPGKSPSRTFIV